MGWTPRETSQMCRSLRIKKEERKALAKEVIIILGLAVPLRFPERSMRESWYWCPGLLLGYTLPRLWSGLFHLSLSLCVEKKT